MSPRHIGVLVAFLCLGLGFWAPFDAVDVGIQRVLGLALFAILFWTTEPIPIELSSLFILLLLPATGMLSFQESFAPFAEKTVWLVFSGMGLSMGISQTGLGDRLAGSAMRFIGTSRITVLTNLHLVGLATAFLIPSGVVRVLLLMPFGLAVVRKLRGRENPLLSVAVLLSLLCGTYFGGAGVLTDTVPNLVAAGQYEAVTGETLFWGQWLIWMFPVIGVARTALCLAVIWVLVGRRLAPDAMLLDAPQEKKSEPESLTVAQKRVIMILLFGVGLWSTDVLHGLAPAYVSLSLLCLALLPGWGPLDLGSMRKINFPFLFYIAALFSLGTALEKSGFNLIFIDNITAVIDLDASSPAVRRLLITLMIVPLDFLMDIAAVAGVMMPGMIGLGVAHGLDSLSVALSVAMATTLVFLPYQSAPFMVAHSFGRIPMGTLSLIMFAISVLSLLLLCPLNVAYWLATGLI